MGIIDVINVWFRYPGFNDFVLRDVSLSVEHNESLMVVGENGSGKTTLLTLMAGLLRPERGSVLFEGKDIYSQLPGVRRRIGFVFQDPDDQLFNPTVYDELAYTVRQLGLGESDVRKLVMDVADRFGIKHLLNRSPFRLSYGEKKLVSLASAIVHNPDVLILDEPTAFLSRSRTEHISKILRDLHRQGMTMVVATHDMGMLNLANRLALIRGGGVVAFNNVEDALANDYVRDVMGLSKWADKCLKDYNSD